MMFFGFNFQLIKQSNLISCRTEKKKKKKMSVEAKNDNKNKKKTDFIDILNTVVNDKLKDHEKMRTHACSVLGEVWII